MSSNHPVYRARPRRDAATAKPSLMNGTFAGVAILAVIAGAMWVALAPLRIWHVTGSDGKMHPDTATYIAYGISGGLLLAILMFFSIRAASKRPNVYTSAGGARPMRKEMTK